MSDPYGLKSTTINTIQNYGETFDIVRGDNVVHQVKGLNSDPEHYILFYSDADVEVGDVARSMVTGVSLYVVRTHYTVIGDERVCLQAYYETDYQRAQQQVAQSSTTVTIGSINNSVLNIDSQLNQVSQQVSSKDDTDHR